MAFDLSTLSSLLKADFSGSSAHGGVVGVDIGASAIKIVQLKEVKGVPTLDTYGELQLGPYENIDFGRSTHLPPQKIIEALIDILREAGATAKSAAFAISYNASFTTLISVPTTEQERLGTMIPVEARKYIPVPLSKVTLEWFPLAVHAEQQKTDVLLSAMYNDARKLYDDVMYGCGLKTVANEIEIFSTMRSVLSPQDSVVAVVDFGAVSTRFYIVQNGIIVKTHSTVLSGVGVTTALADALQIPFTDAEKMKRSVGMRGKEEDPRIQKAIVGAVERGLREIHTVIKRFEESEHTTIEKIVITGSGALLNGLDAYMHDMFSHTIVIANPFAKVAYPAFLEDTLTQGGPVFSGAVGVALRALQNGQ